MQLTTLDSHKTIENMLSSMSSSNSMFGMKFDYMI